MNIALECSSLFGQHFTPIKAAHVPYISEINARILYNSSSSSSIFALGNLSGQNLP